MRACLSHAAHRVTVLRHAGTAGLRSCDSPSGVPRRLQHELPQLPPSLRRPPAAPRPASAPGPSRHAPQRRRVGRHPPAAAGVRLRFCACAGDVRRSVRCPRKCWHREEPKTPLYFPLECIPGGTQMRVIIMIITLIIIIMMIMIITTTTIIIIVKSCARGKEQDLWWRESVSRL